MSHDSQHQAMLVLGAGQLGMAVLRALAPRVAPLQGAVTALVSPHSAESPEGPGPELRRLGADVIGFDLAADQTALQDLFRRYKTIINCTGFVAGPGTQLKITRAVLDAGVERYVPWQFGVDYDVVGRGSGQPVFDEQYEVRQLLRAQQGTEWVIVSTGMFTSFLFEPAFGVVDLARKTVHGLGSWDTKVTVTSPRDIGQLTTAILMAEPRIANEVVFVAGDTLSYGELARLLERATGQTFDKTLWTLDKLRADLREAPDDVMRRYRVAFARGDGMWWEKSGTFNARNGHDTEDVAHYLSTLLGAATGAPGRPPASRAALSSPPGYGDA